MGDMMFTGRGIKANSLPSYWEGGSFEEVTKLKISFLVTTHFFRDHIDRKSNSGVRHMVLICKCVDQAF